MRLTALRCENETRQIHCFPHFQRSLNTRTFLSVNSRQFYCSGFSRRLAAPPPAAAKASQSFLFRRSISALAAKQKNEQSSDRNRSGASKQKSEHDKNPSKKRKVEQTREQRYTKAIEFFRKETAKKTKFLDRLKVFSKFATLVKGNKPKEASTAPGFGSFDEAKQAFLSGLNLFTLWKTPSDAFDLSPSSSPLKRKEQLARLQMKLSRPEKRKLDGRNRKETSGVINLRNYSLSYYVPELSAQYVTRYLERETWKKLRREQEATEKETAKKQENANAQPKSWIEVSE